MALRLYNTRTRSIEPFEPQHPPKVSAYVCGMTPSFHPHLGHARTFITFDVLRRHLRNKGFDVYYVQNITDIDDRIIERANLDNIAWDAVVARYLSEYDRCAEKLGLLPPELSPRATQEMPCIIEFIERLVAMGNAYETNDGVYFSVDKFSRYGELSNRNVDELRAGERIAVREEKRDPLDFALWKKQKPGEPAWPSPWGPGRPGWHIECSAMCKHYLGDQFDIHGGAADLVFPHHENEVAQTETATEKHPMARYWMHGGLLQVDNQKMSKSLGNFVPLEEILSKYPATAVRYLFFQTGYRKPSNFTTGALEAAAKGLRGLYADLDELRAKAASNSSARAAQTAAEEFDAFLDDDLNTSGALGWLQKYTRERRERAAAIDTDRVDASVAAATIERCLNVLGLPATAQAAGFKDVSGRTLSEQERSALSTLAGDGSGDDAALIQRVIALREKARAAKDFAASDRLRDELAKVGVALRDSKNGTEWHFNGDQ